jgi:hypothetical protein
MNKNTDNPGTLVIIYDVDENTDAAEAQIGAFLAAWMKEADDEDSSVVQKES